MASPNVNNLAEAAEVICLHDGRRIEQGYVGHAVVKNLCLFRMLGEVGERVGHYGDRAGREASASLHARCEDS